MDDMQMYNPQLYLGYSIDTNKFSRSVDMKVS